MTRCRGGISLVEVLIAMFVLSIGLLGLASLIPVGRFEITSASNADRSSTAFRAGFRETKVRRMLNPLMWLDVDVLTGGTGLTWFDVNHEDYPNHDDSSAPPLAIQLMNGPLQGGHSICIDPWFIMNNQALGSTDPNRLRSFPVVLDNDPDPDGEDTFPNPPRMTRVTLRSWLSSAAPFMPRGVAERVFTWQDDVVFSLPDNQEFRPQLQFDWANLGSGNQPVRRQVAGDYTWLVTITPATAQLVPMPGGSISGGTPPMMAAEYTVSVVVFYRRFADADVAANPFRANRQGQPPTERMVYADFLYGSGLGGGTVRLRLPPPQPPNDPSDPDTSDIPRLRPNRWLMLCGWVLDNSGASPLFRPVFKWYRIGAVGDGPQYSSANDEWFQDVTLVGPDWMVNDALTGMGGGTPTFLDADNNSSTPNTVWAALFDGIIAVGQKTMPLESWNMWSP